MIREGVAGQKEHRQTVRMGRGRRRHHVQRPRADGRGGDHHLPPALGLGETDCGQRMDCSFCPRHVGRRSCTASSASERQHISVFEYAEDAREQGRADAFNVDNCCVSQRTRAWAIVSRIVA